jgi:hypothetical protein
MRPDAISALPARRIRPDQALAVRHGEDREREQAGIDVPGGNGERGIEGLCAHRAERYAQREPRAGSLRRGAMSAAGLLLAIVVLVAACQPGPSVGGASPSPSAQPAPGSSPPHASAVSGATVLVTVELTGGECANGPCGSTYVIHADGRVDGPPAAPRSVSPDEIAKLVALRSATDWDAVRSVPFTGDCPTATDGQKSVYAFPADTGDLVFDSCEFDLSGVEVFQVIDRLLFAGA